MRVYKVLMVESWTTPGYCTNALTWHEHYDREDIEKQRTDLLKLGSTEVRTVFRKKTGEYVVKHSFTWMDGNVPCQVTFWISKGR